MPKETKETEQEKNQEETTETEKTTESSSKTKSKSKRKAASPKKKTTKKADEASEGTEKKRKRSASPSRSKRPKGHVEVIDIPKHMAPKKAKRESREIERFTEGASKKVEKKVVIAKGKGKKLKDCANVEAALKKVRKSDEILKLVYSVMYGRSTKSTPIKEHIGEFSGVVYDDDKGREKLVAKIGNHHFNDVKHILRFFGQDTEGTKEELIERLADFLEKPKASDVAYEVTKSPKKRSRSGSRSRSSSRSRSRSSSRKSKKSKSPKKKRSKKDPNAPKKPLTAYLLFCQDHRAEVTKEHPDDKMTDISKRLGKMWKKVSKEDKKKYEKQHEKAKEAYEKKLKAYNSKKKESDSDSSSSSDSDN